MLRRAKSAVRCNAEGYGRPGRREAALTEDEKAAAQRLRAQRMSWDGVARAVGRSVPDLRAELDPTFQRTWKG